MKGSIGPIRPIRPMLLCLLALSAIVLIGCGGTRYTFSQSVIDGPAGVSVVSQAGVSTSRMLTEEEACRVLNRVAEIVRDAAVERSYREIEKGSIYQSY